MPRPLAPRGGNDRVYTPVDLAQGIVRHFAPRGHVLEPCKGTGAFTDALMKAGCEVAYCEIDEGLDFLSPNIAAGHYDWTVTNPPWSLIRPFLKRAMEVSDNVVFLCLVNAFFMKARVRDIKEAGFGFREILFVPTPDKSTGWPQTGFQLGAVHIKRDYQGLVTFSSL